MLLLLSFRSRLFIYLVWALLFFYLLVDDMAEIHEQVEFWISNEVFLPSIPTLRPQDIGELLVSSTVGFFFLLAISITYQWSDQASKEISRSLIVLLGVLAFFSIVIDLLHISALVEDGGELIVMSFTTYFVFSFSSERN